MDGLGEMIGGAGLLGVAAAGLVDTLGKGLLGRRGLAMRGFGAVERAIDHAAPVLRAGLGEAYRETLAEAWRDGRGKGRAPAVIKAGIELGLDRLEAAGGDALGEAARALGLPVSEAGDTKAQARAALEAEADAAVSLAEAQYRGTAKLAAGAVALALSLGVWITLPAETRADIPLYQALLAGLVAIPLAPMAKDIAKAIERLRMVQAG